MRLHTRLARLESRQPPDPRTFRLPPENRAAVDHLFAKVRANPGRWPDMDETLAAIDARHRERTADA